MNHPLILSFELFKYKNHSFSFIPFVRLDFLTFKQFKLLLVLYFHKPKQFIHRYYFVLLLLHLINSFIRCVCLVSKQFIHRYYFVLFCHSHSLCSLNFLIYSSMLGSILSQHAPIHSKILAFDCFVFFFSGTLISSEINFPSPARSAWSIFRPAACWILLSIGILSTLIVLLSETGCEAGADRDILISGGDAYGQKVVPMCAAS